MTIVAELWDDILKAARGVSYSYGRRFSADDIAQGIALDMLENPGRYSDIGGNFRRLILKRAGMRYCAEQAAMFLRFGDEHIYSSEELKKLLPAYYQTTSWPNGLKQPAWSDYSGDVEGFKGALDTWANETRLCVEMLDIDYAMERLTGAQRRVVEKRYRDGERLASKYEQNTHGTAMRFLTYHINERVTKKQVPDFFHEGPGARKGIRNEDPIEAMEEDRKVPFYKDVNALRGYERLMNQVYPSHQPSKYVVNSPWRN